MVYNKKENSDDSSESNVVLINLPPQQIVTFVVDHLMVTNTDIYGLKRELKALIREFFF